MNFFNRIKLNTCLTFLQSILPGYTIHLKDDRRIWLNDMKQWCLWDDNCVYKYNRIKDLTDEL